MQHISYLKEEINYKKKKIEEQLNSKPLQQRINSFQQKLVKEICSDIPSAFWHRKQHIVKLPYIKEFDERKYPQKLDQSK